MAPPSIVELPHGSMEKKSPPPPPSSSRNTWYDTVEEEDQAEPAPTELNTATHPRYLVAKKDKLTIRYVGKGNHTHDVGAIRAN